MFFGLTDSPATFQTMMNEIFEDMISEGVVAVYIDDILIYTKDLEQHRDVTRRVLERLREHKLYLKEEKCEFCRTKVEYLGMIISENTVKMDPTKVSGVRDWPTPKNVTEVQSFPGFENFSRRFIKDFARIAIPLFGTTKKDVPFTWTEDCQRAFDSLKFAMTSAPVLLIPNPLQPYRVEADSSDFATGAVLSQLSPDDSKWHPVAFFSRALSPVERNYEIHDKEMLAIIRALEEWRHFLEGANHPVDIRTDHKNLEYFMSARNLNRRQARWSIYLARFDFTLQHIPGKSMGKPDGLSRRSDHGSGKEDNREITLIRPEMLVINALETFRLKGEESEFLRLIRDANRAGQHEDLVANAVKSLRSLGGRSAHANEWSEDNDVIYHRGKVYVPNVDSLRRKIVAKCHNSLVGGHLGRFKTLELVSRTFWWPGMSKYVQRYMQACDLCLRPKPMRQPPFGELQPTETPLQPWECMSVDFIVELPDSNGYDAILTVVDTVTKRAHVS